MIRRPPVLKMASPIDYLHSLLPIAEFVIGIGEHDFA
jgi:hypothetical protein